MLSSLEQKKGSSKLKLSWLVPDHQHVPRVDLIGALQRTDGASVGYGSMSSTSIRTGLPVNVDVFLFAIKTGHTRWKSHAHKVNPSLSGPMPYDMLVVDPRAHDKV